MQSSTVDLTAVQPTPAAHALEALRTFVSPFTGIVRNLDETLAAPDEHRLITIACEVADGRSTIGAPVEGYTSSEHPWRHAAEAAAIGEALERYSASFVPDRDVISASADELTGAVDPARFALFHETQFSDPAFPFRPFDGRSVVSWIPGFELPGGRRAYLPAQVAFMAWERWADEERISYATSSGLACAPTLEEAVLAGLLELIERDAVMVTWYGRLSLPLLDWSRDRELVGLDARYFAPTGLRYAAVDLSAFFGIPTVLGVVHGVPGTLGALGVGAAAAPTIGVAWRKALAEAFAVQRWVRDRAFEQPEEIDQPAAEIRGFEGHTMHYVHHDRVARAAAFVDGSAERRDTREVGPLEGANVLERIEAVCKRLARHGVSAYAVDVTAPDVRSAGFHVVRVIAPELCQLDAIERARFLGGSRLYEAAHRAGLVDRPLTTADLNPDPHPFP